MSGDAEAFARALDAARLRYFSQIDYRETTGSTNEDAQARLGEPSAGGLAIVTGMQTSGAGRRGRRWVAPRGSGLLFTAILPDAIRTETAWAVPLWVGLAVAAALHKRGIVATLQWPNDLLVEGRKLCGILCVSRISGDRAWIGCGVGLNVARPARHPELEEIVPPPIFLDDVTVLAGDERPQLLVAILRAFEDDLTALRDPNALARRWERAAGLPGARYRFELEEGGEVEGIAQRVAHGGGLVIDAGGEERTIDLATARVVR